MPKRSAKSRDQPNNRKRPRRLKYDRAQFRPLLEQLEDRRLLATFTELGSLLDIDLDIANEKLTVTTLPDGYTLSLTNTVWSGTNTIFSTGSGSSELNVMSADISLVPTTLISIRDSATGASVEFADSTSDTKYVASVDVRLDDPGASEVVFKGTTEFRANAGIDIETTRNVRFDSDSALNTADGDISIVANRQDVASSGNFHGVLVGLNATISTAEGNILVSGQSGGGNTSGVFVHTGSVVRAVETGNITLEGIGAPSSDSRGTFVNGGDISAVNGDITIYGTGGQQGTAATAHGVTIVFGAKVSTSGTGNITLEGQGGTSSGDSNHGVIITDRGTEVSTLSGNITIHGQGGGRGTSSLNIGVSVLASGDQPDGATVRAGASGNLTIDGRGGTSAEGDSNYGAWVGGGASASVDSGALQITGVGGGSANSSSNYGVHVNLEGVIEAGSQGSVTVSGTGGLSSGNNNSGIFINGQDAGITSSGGDVTVTGQGGGSGASSFNYGINVSSAGNISSSSTGRISLTGSGGSGTGRENDGIHIRDNAVISASGSGGMVLNGFGGTGTIATGITMGGNSQLNSPSGDISLFGRAGGTGTSAYNYGVNIGSDSLIATNTADVLLDGVGGITEGSWNRGVSVWHDARITTVNGSIVVKGTGGGMLDSANSTENHGVLITADLLATGSGSISVQGTAGNGGGGGNDGVIVSGLGAGVQTNTGDVSIAGIGGESSGDNNYGVSVEQAGSIITSAAGDVTVTGQGGGTGASGHNYGINISGGAKITGSGSSILNISGTGGSSTGARNKGVVITDGSVISTETGRLNIDGVGGPFNGDAYTGVDVRDEETKVVTSGGDLNVQGSGGGSNDENVDARWHIGVRVGTGAVLGACDGGNTTVVGYGGVAESKANIGVQVIGANAVISGCDGDVIVNGFAGTIGDSSNGTGVIVEAAGEISTTGSGNVRITGVGSKATGDGNRGIAIQTDGARVSTVDGNIYLTGRADGSGNSGSGVGISIETQDNNKTAGIVEATGTGNIYLDGTGANTTGNSNHGVQVTGNEAAVRTALGDIIVTGQGGGSGASANNHGIYVATGSVLTDTVQPEFVDPIAIDDTFHVTGGLLQPQGYNVVANDIEGTNGELTLHSFTQPVHGTVTDGGDGKHLLYEPDGLWFNMESFTYTVVNPSGQQRTANVTVHVEPEVADNIVDFGVTFRDSSGVELTTNEVSVGDRFEVLVTVEDLQTTPEGVFSAYMDLLYDRDHVSVVSASAVTCGNVISGIDFGICFDGEYTSLIHGSADKPGLIDEVGGLRPLINPPGDVGAVELYVVTFQANVAGTAVFATDPADDPVFETTVYGLLNAVDAPEIHYDFGQLVILEGGGANSEAGGPAGGDGRISLNGTGGSSTGNSNLGVFISNAATVSTGAGELEVTGVAGGSGASMTNNGIQIQGAVVSTTSGPLRLSGTGGSTTGKWNRGVGIWNDATVTSATGDVSVNGTGGGTGPSYQNYGVQISNNSVVGTTSTGNVSIIGEGASSDGNSNIGVAVEGTDGRVETSLGNINIQGTGGSGAGNGNRGIKVSASGAISSGTGNLTLSGRAGESDGMYNHGIHTTGASSRILTGDGNLTAVGYGGGKGLNSGGNHGIVMTNESQIASTGLGSISLESHGGTSLGSYNVGLVIRDDSELRSNEGTIEIQSFAGTGIHAIGVEIADAAGGIIASAKNDINIFTDAFDISPAGSITSGNNSSISIAPLTMHSRILLGDDTTLQGAWLQLSDSELDQFNTPNLTIGNSTSGQIIVATNVVREQATNLSLVSAESIVTDGGSLNTGGGTLSLSSGSYGSLEPLSSGMDFTASTTTFSSDSQYQAMINGTTVDTLYSQANITGGVNLGSATLVLTGGYIPLTGDIFTIVENDAADAVTGTFADLPEGSLVSFNTVPLQISYQGGTGNDVTLTAVDITPSIDPIDNLTMAENAPKQTVQLTGIVAGSSASSPLRITATSSNTQLVSAVDVTYTSNATTGSLSFTPEADMAGTTIITVLVEDGGLDNDLSTTPDNATITSSFEVLVTPVYPWHNYSLPEDVNKDGVVTAVDVLTAINEINAGGGGRLSESRVSLVAPFFDVNKDGYLTALDCLLVINRLNNVNYQVALDVIATNIAGQTISSIDVGSLFYITFLAEDLSQDADGVYAAYADLYYDSNAVSLAGSSSFQSPYTAGVSGDTQTLGLIDEWGAFSTMLSPVGTGTKVIAKFPARAATPGQALLSLGAADDLPLHLLLVYGSNDPVPSSLVRYGSSVLEILAGEGEASDSLDIGEGEFLSTQQPLTADPSAIDALFHDIGSR